MGAGPQSPDILKNKMFYIYQSSKKKLINK